jgi:hypothetical protein
LKQDGSCGIEVAVARALVFAAVGVIFGLLVPSCGSSDAKKRPGPQYQSGGDMGDGTLGGGGADTASNTAGDAPAELGGQAGVTNGAGGIPASAAGQGADAGGAAGAAAACPSGLGDCDDDGFCEQDLTLTTSCGDCATSCDAQNGSVVCEALVCRATACNPGFDDCNQDGRDGCETSLVDNDEHCGVCGRDCTAQGTTCATDICGPILLQQNVPISAIGGRTWAFSSVGIMQTAVDDYIVRRMPLDGSPALEVWNGGAATAGLNSLLVIGSDVYWSQSGAPDTVFKKATSAAPDALPEELFFPEYLPSYLQVQGNAFYWVTGAVGTGEPAYVYTRAINAEQTVSGNRIMTVNQGAGHIYDFAVTSDAIYWTTNNDGNGTTIDMDLRTVPLGGGTPATIPAFADGSTVFTTPSTRSCFQPHGDALYFVRDVGTSSLNGIYRYRVGDAAPTKLLSVEGVTNMLVDETVIYFTQGSPLGVSWIPIAGNVAAKMLYKGSATKLIGADETFVYVAYTASSGADTDIFKLVK